MTRLVRLRTAPMPDPGEWCECSDRPSDEDCPLWDADDIGCSGAHVPERRVEPFAAGYRRPQSCIAAAEEVET